MFILNVIAKNIDQTTGEPVTSCQTFTYNTYKEALSKMYYELWYATSTEARIKTSCVIIDENGSSWKNEILE